VQADPDGADDLLERALFQHGEILPLDCASQRAERGPLRQNRQDFEERN
jgi:hypothetical protein